MKQLILRTCYHDLTSFKGFQCFQWKLGKNTAPDWDPKPDCGNGLHGLLWGEGYGKLLNYYPIAKWLVGEINAYIDLNKCVKFPECNVIFIGNQEQATQFLYQNSNDKAICGLIMKGKNLKGGDCSRLTGEDNSNIVAGRNSCVKVGNNSTVTASKHSYVKVGNNSTVKVGDKYCKIGEGCTITTGDNCNIIYLDQTVNVNNGTYLIQHNGIYSNGIPLIVPKTI